MYEIHEGSVRTFPFDGFLVSLAIRVGPCVF